MKNTNDTSKQNEVFIKKTMSEMNENGWIKVKVPVKTEWVDDLTRVTTYEYRERLYVQNVYKALGFEGSGGFYYGKFWEKDACGNITAPFSENDKIIIDLKIES